MDISHGRGDLGGEGGLIQLEEDAEHWKEEVARVALTRTGL